VNGVNTEEQIQIQRRKEQADENQNECEGWAFGRWTDRESMIVSERKKGHENQDELESRIFEDRDARRCCHQREQLMKFLCRMAQELLLRRRERSKAMKVKTNVKAAIGSATSGAGAGK
jgi:hypothetical protein